MRLLSVDHQLLSTRIQAIAFLYHFSNPDTRFKEHDSLAYAHMKIGVLHERIRFITLANPLMQNESLTLAHSSHAQLETLFALL